MLMYNQKKHDQKYVKNLYKFYLSFFHVLLLMLAIISVCLQFLTYKYGDYFVQLILRATGFIYIFIITAIENIFIGFVKEMSFREISFNAEKISIQEVKQSQEKVRRVREEVSRMKQYLNNDAKINICRKYSRHKNNISQSTIDKISARYESSIDYSRTNRQLEEENEILKKKLNKQKKLRKTLNRSLNKQLDLIKSFSNDFKQPPFKNKQDDLRYQRSIRPKKNSVWSSRSEKQSIREKNTIKSQLSMNMQNRLKNSGQNSFRSTSKDENRIMNTVISFKKIQSLDQKYSDQFTKETIKGLEQAQIESSQSQNNIISDQQILSFLQNKLGELMKKSKYQENRPKKLKIRNEIGRVVCQMNRIKDIIKSQNSHKQYISPYPEQIY